MNDAQVERLISALEGMVASKALGFGSEPKPEFVFVSNEEDSLWHHWDKAEEKRVPIKETALTGRITDAQMFVKEFKGKPQPKLNLSIEADRAYIVTSGLDSTFSRGLLFAINQYEGELTTNTVVTLSVRGGEEKTVLPNLYVGSEIVIPKWDRDADMTSELAKARARLGIDTPQDATASPTTPPEPLQPPVGGKMPDEAIDEDEGLPWDEEAPYLSSGEAHKLHAKIGAMLPGANQADVAKHYLGLDRVDSFTELTKEDEGLLINSVEKLLRQYPYRGWKDKASAIAYAADRYAQQLGAGEHIKLWDEVAAKHKEFDEQRKAYHATLTERFERAAA